LYIVFGNEIMDSSEVADIIEGNSNNFNSSIVIYKLFNWIKRKLLEEYKVKKVTDLLIKLYITESIN